jgi:hypothetical protein
MITVAPPTLLVDKNIREAKLSKAFMEHVHELGVLQPLIVHHSEDGLRVLMGHRRTLAAVGHQEMHVIVTETPEDAKLTGAPDAATVKKALAARKNAKGTAALDVGRALYPALALAEFADNQCARSQLEEIIERRPEQCQQRLAQLRNERALSEKRAEADAPYVERG